MICKRLAVPPQRSAAGAYVFNWAASGRGVGSRRRQFLGRKPGIVRRKY